MEIFLASDHGGFTLKEDIKKLLQESDFTVKDFGPNQLREDDDYPDYIIPMIKKFIKNSPDKNRAIVVCRNGVGVSMLANKFPEIRATLSWTPEHAQSSRTDDNTNVLALPSDYLTADDAHNTVKTWLETPFSNAERHKRRLKKIEDLENSLIESQ